MQLTQRKAKLEDLSSIVALLGQDELGKTRETASDNLDKAYIDAFHNIHNDPKQYLMVVEKDQKIVGSCHLSIMHSLTFSGSKRMNIEAVRVRYDCRGQQIGQWMITQAMRYGKEHGASIFQLTTNKKRPDALRFYEKLGFKTTHEGMKYYL
jgi:ribosomal protein S18 acetylase RimI-like enzyme